MKTNLNKSLSAIAISACLVLGSGSALAYHHGGWHHNGWHHGGGWGNSFYIGVSPGYYNNSYYRQSGYYNCGWVGGHYDYNGYWIPRHRACW